ncbi:hypothetical protein BH11ACT3_BH11ACT3_19610 [soil metagenome]
MSDASDRDDRSRDGDGPRKPGGAGGTGAPRGRAGAGGRPDRGSTGSPRREGGAPKRDGAAPKREYPPRDSAPKRDYPKRDGAAPKRDYPKRDGAPPPKRDYPPRDGPPKRDYPRRDGAAPKRDYPPRDGAPKRDYHKRDGAPPRRDFPKRDGAPFVRDDRRTTRPPQDDRPRHDDPAIPDEVEPKDLNKYARMELKTLAKENADEVARHMAMAASLIDDDPALAHQHALAASRRAGRIGIVRETLAITAYATGDFALALRELRTYRRITGKNDQLPLMVDSERGVGRPDRALELGRSVPRAELDVPVQVELAIAMSGARLDLGQTDAALTELQIPQLDPDRAFAWSPALFDAYATVLEELGRSDEAAEWFGRSERAAEALDSAADPEGDDDTVEIIEEEYTLDEAEDGPPAIEDADGVS